ncbi:MAG: glycerol-3-phosphate 1-O-acyltransferase PlsY [Gammaproteobacteria bacterium]|jgi:glycerol-3-phosphate acyltransferase PlsY|nr:glycerol-3-phosphate 1-O-acyltransferase PlsY [Gammaproteobacteria bacterium]
MLLDISICIAAYLLGSISSAIVICKACGLPDPREQGSGNPGATNVLRYGGKKAAAAVFLGDMLKGLLAVLLARWLELPAATIAAVGLLAFAGHVWPVFFGFRGGKGVATAFGVLLGWAWLPAALLAAVWIIVAAVSRISSLGAISAALFAPLAMWGLQDQLLYAFATLLLSIVLLWRHRSNLSNLLRGSEPRIGRKN